MRLYLGLFFFAALFSALLLAVFFAAMSLRDDRSQKLRNCNKHPRRLAHERAVKPLGLGMAAFHEMHRTERKRRPGETGTPEIVEKRIVTSVRAYAVTGTP